jgi:hypothetical protein
VAFPKERRDWRASLKKLAELEGRYAVRRVEDGVVLLQRGGQPDAAAKRRLDVLIGQGPATDRQR